MNLKRSHTAEKQVPATSPFYRFKIANGLLRKKPTLSPLEKICKSNYTINGLKVLCKKIPQKDAPRAYVYVLTMALKLKKRVENWPQNEFEKSLDILESKMSSKWTGWAKNLRKEYL